jgi:hypothetical protein
MMTNKVDSVKQTTDRFWKPLPSWKSVFQNASKKPEFYNGSTSTARKKPPNENPERSQQHKRDTVRGLTSEDVLYYSTNASESQSQSSDSLRKRNLFVSNTLQKQLNAKHESSRFIPALSGFSDMQIAYRVPKVEAANNSLPAWQSKVHVFESAEGPSSQSNTNVREDLHYPRRDIDALYAVERLKARILAGGHVSMHEIHAVKHQIDPEDIKNHRMKYKIPREPKRKRLFCVKGIIHIPTPHKPHPSFNTFGSPVDLR